MTFMHEEELWLEWGGLEWGGSMKGESKIAIKAKYKKCCERNMIGKVAIYQSPEENEKVYGWAMEKRLHEEVLWYQLRTYI